MSREKYSQMQKQVIKELTLISHLFLQDKTKAKNRIVGHLDCEAWGRYSALEKAER